MKVQAIQEIVYEVRNSPLPLSEKVEQFTAKYPDFVKECPKLFDAAIDSTFPLTFLDLMISQINKLDSKKTNKDTADKAIVEALNEQYIPKK